MNGPRNEQCTVHIVDGTYELFRQFFARPSHLNDAGDEVSGARAVVRGMMSMLEEGVTHLGVATDHVIESFRNDLYPGYKDGSGLDPVILSQFAPLEEGLIAIGVATYPMVEYEADDAMASLARLARGDSRVERVLLCTADKDLAQCVNDGVDGGAPVVQFDRRNNRIFNEAAVIDKFGVPPASIPDWLGLVGDSADGFPGLAGWGAKSAATVLSRYSHIDRIPLAAGQWDITVRSGAKLAKTLAENLDEALLFRRIATLDDLAPTASSVDELRWNGPKPNLAEVAMRLDDPDLVQRATKLAGSRRSPE